MPHFGLMDENILGPVESLLMRARLHIRGGKRRLCQGKISLGIITLYDGLICAMQWYIAKPGHKNNFMLNEDEDQRNDRDIFRALVRSGVINSGFDYNAFDDLAGKALYQDMSSYDFSGMLKGIESVMTRLGVMPFDENELPPEDPETV
ncbi:MAG: hypothetical protein C4526_06855 [Nitrospiraceae bacterium]|nr:MAG: hypothetical protein C4526_06855 [Nitrospiraceae bacterium]